MREFYTAPSEPELIPFPSYSVGSIGPLGSALRLSKPCQHMALADSWQEFAKRQRNRKKPLLICWFSVRLRAGSSLFFVCPRDLESAID
jgi:hypothetical protein